MIKKIVFATYGIEHAGHLLLFAGIVFFIWYYCQDWNELREQTYKFWPAGYRPYFVLFKLRRWLKTGLSLQSL